MHIPRDSFCPLNSRQIKKYPNIEKLGFIPLPNRDSCEIALRPIREAYETPVEKIDGFALTYAKLQSLTARLHPRVLSHPFKLSMPFASFTKCLFSFDWPLRMDATSKSVCVYTASFFHTISSLFVWSCRKMLIEGIVSILLFERVAHPSNRQK
jgi:hypothetical protein